MQFSVIICNNINFNLAQQIKTSNHHSPTNIDMNMKMDKTNVQQPDDIDGDNDENADEEMSDTEYLTPSRSDDKEERIID